MNLLESSSALPRATQITILLKDVTSMTKEKTAKLIPNAIQISTDTEKVGYVTFSKSAKLNVKPWRNTTSQIFLYFP